MGPLVDPTWLDAHLGDSDPDPRVGRSPGSRRRAARAGDSLNTWLVEVIRAASSDRAIEGDLGLSSLPFGDAFKPFRKDKGNRRMTGWL